MSVIIPQARLRGAIFDLDGTLLDSMTVWHRIDQEFFARRGMQVPPDYAQATAHLGAQATAEYTINRFRLQESAQDIIAEWGRMAYTEYSENIPLKPYAAEYLRKLKAQGVRLGVATANESALYAPALKRCGVYDLFESFTTVGEVARGKGYPDIYLRAAEKLGLEPRECTVFEDVREGVRGAADGGFFTVGVYDAAAAETWEELCRLAHVSIAGYAELISS